MKKKLRQIAAVWMSLVMMIIVVEPVRAATISELQQQQQEHQNKLNEVTGQINGLEDEQSIIEEQIEDLNAELINMMTSISLLEDQISQKEQEISDKEAEIAEAQAAYEEAVRVEIAQYEAMKIRIKFMYEKGNTSYLELFMQADSFSDMVNKADYIEDLYDYDRKLLKEYQETEQKVAAMKAALEEEKAALETEEQELQVSKKDLVDQQSQLDVMKAQKKKESANYEAQIKQAEAQAASYKKQIEAEAAQIKKLQEEAKKPKNGTAAASGSYKVTAFNTSIISNASGSDLGKKVAMYGCQYIGNPYVAGGTSLTNGADCSGFTYRIYADFGYSIPRTSYMQRNAGTAVGSLAEAQPGDLICYDGHVALYCGGGYIVHASTERTGIKISNANYRSIAAIRRIIK
ncbi:MAG: NlpC/P60 family protein [Lachnospiraceae bacterium]|nr:NlpC/P60 family protein [Lachnospiraceae bacterium]